MNPPIDTGAVAAVLLADGVWRLVVPGTFTTGPHTYHDGETTTPGPPGFTCTTTTPAGVQRRIAGPLTSILAVQLADEPQRPARPTRRTGVRP